MILINIIFQNEIIKFISCIILFSFLFYALGRMIQQKFKIFVLNYHFSFVIGFVVYSVITFVVYLPFVFFIQTGDVLYWVEVIKNLFLLIFCLMSYDYWKISISKITKKSAFSFMYSFLLYFLSFFLFFYFSEQLDWFNEINYSDPHYLELDLFIDSNRNEWFNPIGKNSDSIASYSAFQTNYYFLINLAKLQNIDTETLILYYGSTLGLILVLSSIMTIFSEEKIKKINYLLAPFIIVIFILIMGSSVSYEGFYFALPIILILCLTMYKHASSRISSQNYITTSFVVISILFLFISVGLMLYILISVFILFYCILKKEPIVYNAVIFFLLLFPQISLILYVENSLIGIFFIFISLLIIIPLWSLQFKTKKQELVNLENKIYQKRDVVVFIISFALFILFFLITVFNWSEFISFINDYFSYKIFGFSDKTILFYVLITIVILILFLPFFFLIHEIIFRNKVKDKLFYKLFIALFLVILNPISLFGLSYIFQLNEELILVFWLALLFSGFFAAHILLGKINIFKIKI